MDIPLWRKFTGRRQQKRWEINVKENARKKNPEIIPPLKISQNLY